MTSTKLKNEHKETRESYLEIVLDTVKAFSWQLFGLILLVSFWSPLQQSASQIPSILNRADVITLAGVTIKVSKRIKKKATPEVKNVITNLSKDGIQQILKAEGDISYFDTRMEMIEHSKLQTKELRDLGVFTEVSPSELDEINKKNGTKNIYMVRFSDLGKKCKEFLILINVEFVQALQDESE